VPTEHAEIVPCRWQIPACPLQIFYVKYEKERTNMSVNLNLIDTVEQFGVPEEQEQR